VWYFGVKLCVAFRIRENHEPSKYHCHCSSRYRPELCYQSLRLGAGGFASAEDEVKGSVIGALRLYLDFINLFIMLLRITGNRG
jgi:hypothetical protein